MQHFDNGPLDIHIDSITAHLPLRLRYFVYVYFVRFLFMYIVILYGFVYLHFVWFLFVYILYWFCLCTFCMVLVYVHFVWFLICTFCMVFVYLHLVWRDEGIKKVNKTHGHFFIKGQTWSNITELWTKFKPDWLSIRTE